MITKEAEKSSRMPLLLSAFVYPGAGQFMQRRWIAAVFYATTFTVFIVMLLINVLRPMLHNLNVAVSWSGSSSDQALQTISIPSVLFPFLVALFFYIANLLDASYVARRRSRPKPPTLPTMLALLACFCFKTAAADTNTEITSKAENLFRSVESRFDGIRNLSYTVEKTTRSDRRTVTEQWTMRYQQPDLLRIDYELPVPRQLIVNRHDMWEYIPAARKAMHTPLDKLTGEQRSAFMASVLGRVAVDGLRLGDYQGMLQRVVSVRPDGVDTNDCVVEGRDPKFIVEIDTARNVPLRTETYDNKGTLKVRTVASELAEIAAGFWFPKKLLATYGTANGYVESSIELTHVRLNEDFPADIFDFAPREGIAVVENTPPLNERNK